MLFSGVDKTVGAVYKYTNVATISGTQIDAYVTITGITNATLVTLDVENPTGYPTTSPPAPAASLFAPEINTTAANGKVDFQFTFKDVNGNNLTLLNFYNNSIDIDGQGTPGTIKNLLNTVVSNLIQSVRQQILL